ncbi:DNA topoisomerase [Methanobrevibacter arboriphilus]|uniref:DNA topoisomerase n=1 Tax=Methanobrevibacter arboriphilus TaxID=39441 RepID=UPI000B2DCFBC|nr:DNA topoisomerase [Methanobrevibacter arboriphilus]
MKKIFFPAFKKGDNIKVNEILSEEKETKPPARYNEASLIKELEKKRVRYKSYKS